MYKDKRPSKSDIALYSFPEMPYKKSDTINYAIRTKAKTNQAAGDIIANLLVRGKTIQVVSNNNSATQNVLEKLDKYDVGFLAATLGKRENKQAFIDSQTGRYPDLSAWKKDPQELIALKEQVEQLSKEVADCFGKQERLAVAKQELDALEVEARYFDQYCEDSKLVKPLKAPRKGLKSVTILRILQECETRSEQQLPLSFWHKLKSSIIYGVYEWKFDCRC